MRFNIDVQVIKIGYSYPKHSQKSMPSIDALFIFFIIFFFEIAYKLEYIYRLMPYYL